MVSIHDKEGFEALIKPITDFNKIEIDLCRSLEEYMSHIDSVEAKPSTFAEAALLVQNSAAIYSKKVDSLWTSVLQLLEGLRKNSHSNKVNGENESDEEEGGGAQAARKKRVHATAAAIQDFLCIDNICSERCLDINFKKLKKLTKNNVKQIVLNAAMKVKTDHNVTCTVYDSVGEVMGKKDEFKLHWKMSSNGTLHEDFVNSHSRNRRKEGGCIDDTDDDMVVDEFMPPGDDFPPCDADFQNHNESIFPTPPQNSEDVPMSEFIAENEFEAGAQRMSMRKENIVSVEDLAKKAWEPVPFDFNMPEKPARKTNVLKVPDSLQNKSRKENLKRRRELIDINFPMHSFLTIDGLVEKYLKADQLNKFLCQYELLRSVQAENQLRKKMLSRRKKAYQELVIREASKEFAGEFGGFPDMDPDSDDEGGGFNGFDDNTNKFVANDINVPLPDNDGHLPNLGNDIDDNYDFYKEVPEVNTFEAEAAKTLEQYHKEKNQEEEKRLSGLCERVAAWHNLIKPKLEEAERTKHFDIQEYGSRVLDKFPKNSTNPKDNVKLFSEIVAGEPKGEVARIFLTTLCLANTSNIELTKTNPDKMAMDCLQLRLLSRTRHHEEMHQMMENGK